MVNKMSDWKTKGMNKDLSVSAFSPEFAFENINLRLSTNESNTLLSWVNEKGTLALTLSLNLKGVPIGTAVLNHKLVVFTKGTEAKPDYIYVLEYSNDAKTAMTVTSLYNGNLNFSTTSPIETLVSYEAEAILKVYWTDNKNQPRVINIAADSTERASWNDTTFDFVNTLQLTETVTIEKKLGASGMFASGVIQYAFTYYHKYGQETNIFYTSPLQYISYKERGASPEDKIENAFLITVSNVDTNFDYLRIYSILRTSVDATPICKRIQDIAIKGLTNRTASYLDTGTSGNTVDPMELQYKGGEAIIAKTLEQKDNTLFLGNFKVTRPRIEADLATSIKGATDIDNTQKRKFFPTSITTSNYVYASLLTAYKANSQGNKTSLTVPCGGFKAGDVYRLGVLFQHKTGKWSDPIWIKDESISVSNRPEFIASSPSNPYVNVPVFKGTLSGSGNTVISDLYTAGYRRIRPVVVFPEIQDRNVICQGVANPTVYTANHRYEQSTAYEDATHDLYAQSSWVFRPSTNVSLVDSSDMTVCPKGTGTLPYASNALSYNPAGTDNIRAVEIQGVFDSHDKFMIDRSFNTLHSPDIEFDDTLANVDFINVHGSQVGYVRFSRTLSDIDILTETPPISNAGSGFVHKSFIKSGLYGIVSGLFYDDYLVDDNDDIQSYSAERSPVKYMVYLWHKDGSLNNDINRPADKGISSAVLKKKVISNLRVASTVYSNSVTDFNFSNNPQLYASDEPTIIKLDDRVYRGNIDTMLVPEDSDGMYFAFNSISRITDGATAKTTFKTAINRKTFAAKVTEGSQEVYSPGVWRYNSPTWELDEENIGDDYSDLVLQKGAVRMKYKSTPHLVLDSTGIATISTEDLAVVEVVKDSGSVPMRFGGSTEDALKENIWVPCGEPVSFGENTPSISFEYSYGDAYYQRYDCLKTYAYTPEDVNQVIEIGSFMLETRVNIDGRYDRNRGLLNNLNMSPRNFNLINPIYSQKDNFFTYRILDEDFYKLNTYPNQITWSKTKESGAEVDLWTNVTLASSLELDGSNGELNSLQRLNNLLIAFLDTGISHILYNDNVQVASTNGVPIEIANSGKVQGKDYKSNTIGCSNKWSIVNTATGIYFMDSHDKSIFMFNGLLTNVSGSLGFNSWAKQNIPDIKKVWTPNGFLNFVSYYDRLNLDILFINSNNALAYSERLGAFISFYDYGGTPYFCNLDNTGVWIRSDCSVWKHNSGNYCEFFGVQKLFSMTLIGNPEPQLDKIFTNIEFRASIDGEGTVSSNTFTPYLPFNTLETWDEYQHGLATLGIRNGSAAMKHHSLDNNASLKRKFRIWRCDIPRDNYPVDSLTGIEINPSKGITRYGKHPIDRMRNPWLYLKLEKNALSQMPRVEVHDIKMYYFT